MPPQTESLPHGTWEMMIFPTDSDAALADLENLRIQAETGDATSQHDLALRHRDGKGAWPRKGSGC